MKNIKKIFSLMIAFVMMFGFALTTVHANTTTTTTGSIEITKVKPDSSYDVYKILDATYSGSEQNKIAAYTINEAWRNIFTASNKTQQGNDSTLLSSMVDKFFDIFEVNSAYQAAVKSTVTNLDGELKLLAERFSAWISSNPTDPSVPNANTHATAATTTDPNANYTYTAATDTTDSKLTINNVGFGYFFVTSTTGSIVSTGSATPTATIEEKNAEPAPEKKVINSATRPQTFDANKDFSDAKVGDILKFTIKIDSTKGIEKSVVITDTMSSGLTYKNDLVIATSYAINPNSTELVKLDNTTDYTVSTATDSTTQSTILTVTLTESGREKLNNSDLYIYYTAEVNSTALVSDQSNKVNVKFDPNIEREDETIILTDYELNLYKFGGVDTNNKLEGVTFTLKSTGENATNYKFTKADAGYYYLDDKATSENADILTTDATGTIKIRGLGAGTFVLTEETTLNGYNKPAVSLTFTISEAQRTTDNGTIKTFQTLTLADDHDLVYKDTSLSSDKIDIQNTTGAQLPSTGGSGTTMMYIAGGALLIGAVVLMITRKRVSE